MVSTAQVAKKFLIASAFMWVLPVAILYGFQNDWVPGFTHMSSQNQTLLSGFLAVIAVNVVLAFYICLAMKEPSDKHEPDPGFVAKAKASLNQSTDRVAQSSSPSHNKNE